MVAEAPAHKKTIFEYAPDSHGAEDYRRVVGWLDGDSVAAPAPAPENDRERELRAACPS